MGTVDLWDDSIERFVVWRYAFDPACHQRRHQVVAVVGQSREFEKIRNRLNKRLRRRRACSEQVDLQEGYSGTVLQPGAHRLAANGHLVKRAIAHGVWPAQLRQVELPSNVGVLEF